MLDESGDIGHTTATTGMPNAAESRPQLVANDPTAARTITIDGEPWPWLLRWQPRHLLSVVVVFIALTSAAWIAVDAFNVGGLGDRLETPLWRNLYDRSLVDVAQWVLLALAVVAAGYLSGRIAREGWRREASFFLLLGLGLSLMLIEEAGNIRHPLDDNLRENFGDRILGIDHTLIAYGPVFAAVSVIPLYALVRYGRDIWRVRASRRHLIGGYALFAMVAVASLVKNIGGLYVTLGGALDSMLGGVRLLEGNSRDWNHLVLMDATVEESIEAIAAASMLAMVLAFAQAVRCARITVEASQHAEPRDPSQPYSASSRSR